MFVYCLCKQSLLGRTGIPVAPPTPVSLQPPPLPGGGEKPPGSNWPDLKIWLDDRKPQAVAHPLPLAAVNKPQDISTALNVFFFNLADFR